MSDVKCGDVWCGQDAIMEDGVPVTYFLGMLNPKYPECRKNKRSDKVCKQCYWWQKHHRVLKEPRVRFKYEKRVCPDCSEIMHVTCEKCGFTELPQNVSLGNVKEVRDMRGKDYYVDEADLKEKGFVIDTRDKKYHPDMADAIQYGLKAQIGGNHYKDMAIQPVEYCMKNKLNYGQSNVIKYITRYNMKNGIEDLKKAKHMIELLAEIEYGEKI